MNRIKTGYLRSIDADYRLPTVDPNFWTITYSVRGAGRFRFSQGDLFVASGDAVLIAPAARQRCNARPSEAWDLLWAAFDPPARWADLLRWPVWGDGLFRLQFEGAIREKIAERLESMHRLSIMPSHRAPQLAINALEAALLLADTVNPLARARESVDPALRQVLEYVAENLDRPLSTEELAGISGQSVSRMSRLFRREIGISPQAFVERQRIAKASELLCNTTLAIKDVSAQLGFSSPYYFARRFKRVTGASPSDHRADQ